MYHVAYEHRFVIAVVKNYILFQEENVTVTKDFRRVENAYQMEAEVCIHHRKRNNHAPSHSEFVSLVFSPQN